MVAPEQCATAPKTLASKQAAAPAAAKTSTTRVVLLAVLALAAATGAMFGVVVFGNEFTKDMHPKGATLVDSEDRAVATAAVESYVSLLDLPLLGTAELNKVDGITFSTHKGIEHRKVTGYTVTKETAAVGDSEVHTPRLSLAWPGRHRGLECDRPVLIGRSLWRCTRSRRASIAYHSRTAGTQADTVRFGEFSADAQCVDARGDGSSL